MLKIKRLTFDRSASLVFDKLVGEETINLCSDRSSGESEIQKLLAPFGDKKHGYNDENGYWWGRDDGRKYTYTIE
jgi:hypothetical protein